MFCILKHYLQEWVCQILEYSITSWWRKKKEVGSGRGTLGLLHVNKNQITGTCGFISVPLPLLQHFCVSKFLMALWMSIHLRTKYICYSSNNISHDIKSISRVLFQGKQVDKWLSHTDSSQREGIQFLYLFPASFTFLPHFSALHLELIWLFSRSGN